MCHAVDVFRLVEVEKIVFDNLFKGLEPHMGLRKSDIRNLTWQKIQPYGNGGMYITVRMQNFSESEGQDVPGTAEELDEGGRDNQVHLLPLRPTHLWLTTG